MARPATAAHKANEKSRVKRKSKQVRKAQLLTRGVPSVTRSIADAICIKKGNLFLVTQPDGNIPVGDGHGFGLYYHDCRYLGGYQLQIADTVPIVLAGVTGEVGTATFGLTNPHLELGNGRQLASGEIGIGWSRQIDPAQLQLIDTIDLKNYSLSRVNCPLTLSFGSHFEDIFAIRGLFSEKPGKLHAPEWKGGDLVFAYDGADGYARRLSVAFSPAPNVRRARSVGYGVEFDRLESREIHVTLTVSEVRSKSKEARPSGVQPGAPADPKQVLPDASADWFSGWPEIQSDSLLLNQVVERARRDLESLHTSIRGEGFFAAGIPWFTTLFGRDSLITGLQVLPMNAEIATETLRLLATYQAHETDPRRDAQPGKILHELRVGELAATGSIPHSPYYGTVDATPLFLILASEYVKWTGNLALFDELRGPLEQALRWIDNYGDSNADGYVDYKTASDQGLANQGWKDSIDAVLNSDGSFANPPIALAEVQGYIYRAKLGMAELYDRKGLRAQAATCRKSAEVLRSKFNRDFWSDRLGTYVLALQAGGSPAAVVASNAGQVLWSGIAEPEQARRTVQRLMSSDMFTGWGIRTLSQLEKGYNPIGYHVGSIWPHDNAMIAHGFRRYGFHDEAIQIFNGILSAAMNFEEFQLPELYSGFARDQYGVPVHYPAACHPQAWAAGSIPYLLCGLLGLEPNAMDHKLVIRHPMLPESVNSVDITGLRIGPYTANVRYCRAEDGRTVVEALKSEPGLQVQIQ